MLTDDNPRKILRDELLNMIQQLGGFRCKSLDRVELLDSKTQPVLGWDLIGFSVCSDYDPNADFHGVNNAPRCKIVFDPSDIKAYKSHPGNQTTNLGTFEYADPELVGQLFKVLENAGLNGIRRAECDNGPRETKGSLWQQLASFCDRRSGEA